MIKIPKIHIEGALYYVTTRGDNNEDIFKEPEDYKTYLGLLRKYKEQYGFKLFSFMLAPNHLHLLFELKMGITISDIMHDLNGNYTKYFNSKYERKGHLFQERSKMVLAEKDKYLLPIIAYMHLNPYYCVIASEQRERSNLKEIASSPEFTLSEAEGAPRNDTHRLDSCPYSSHVLYSAMSAARHSEGGLRPLEESYQCIDSSLRPEPVTLNEMKGNVGFVQNDESGVLQQPPERSEREVGEGLDLTEEMNEVLKKLPVNHSSYAGFMKNISQEEIKILAKHLKKNTVLGCEKFREAAKLKAEAYWQEKYRQVMATLRQCISGFENKKMELKEWEEELK